MAVLALTPIFLLLDVFQAGLPIRNPSTFRHPAVDAYRIMITGNGDDLNPFYIASKAVGGEAIIVYGFPVYGQTLQERLSNSK